MAIGQRYYTPNAFDVDATGTPYPGGQLFFYQTGTSTPQTTYQDVGLSVANANPVVADASGHFGNIFLSSVAGYSVIFQDQNGVQIWAADPVGPAAGGAQSSTAGIVGEIRAFAGPSGNIPAAWYLCAGQAVSRTGYAAGFAAIGTTWGAGDGSTTFNLPDLRGRVLAGLDNMGGTAANRITAGVSGVPGTTLGGTGGGQLAQADTFTATSTAAVTDPGHSHSQQSQGNNVNGSGAFSNYSGAAAFLGKTTGTSMTGITVAVTTSVAGVLTGSTQNVQPTAMLNFIIYLGA